jgi:hypothetical protein
MKAEKEEKQPKPQKVAQATLTFYDDGVVTNECLEIIKTKRTGTKRNRVTIEEFKTILKVNSIIYNVDSGLMGTKTIDQILSSEE